MDNFLTFLRTRRSIRRFKPDPVPDSVLRNILQTATFAPSAHNRQPWRFVVLSESDSKVRFAEVMGREFHNDLERDGLPVEEITSRVEKSRLRISSAPVVIILCMETGDMDQYPDQQRQTAEHLLAVQSTANAGMHVLLAAHAEGLGGVWMCSPVFAQQPVQKELQIPETWLPQAMFLIGYPLEAPEVRKRKSIDDLVRWSQFPGGENNSPSSAPKQI